MLITPEKPAPAGPGRLRPVIMNFLAMVVFLTCLPSALIDFALPKWKTDKNIRIEDAYKWTHQAMRGGEHAVPDTESARKWLMNEWGTLGLQKSGEPVWEPLCPGGEIGRLNLRAFRDRGGKADDILAAFLTSSREYRSDGKAFIAAWNELGLRLNKGPAGNLDYEEWKTLDITMKKKNYPAIHHSNIYKQSNGPAYRIITASEMKKLLVIRNKGTSSIQK